MLEIDTHVRTTNFKTGTCCLKVCSKKLETVDVKAGYSNTRTQVTHVFIFTRHICGGTQSLIGSAMSRDKRAVTNQSDSCLHAMGVPMYQ